MRRENDMTERILSGEECFHTELIFAKRAVLQNLTEQRTWDIPRRTRFLKDSDIDEHYKHINHITVQFQTYFLHNTVRTCSRCQTHCFVFVCLISLCQV